MAIFLFPLKWVSAKGWPIISNNYSNSCLQQGAISDISSPLFFLTCLWQQKEYKPWKWGTTTRYYLAKPMYQWRSLCQDPACSWTILRPHHHKETKTEVVFTCLPFIRSGQNRIARHSWGGRERRQGRQKKRWEDIIREWKDLEFTKSQRAVENREKRRRLVVKSSVVPVHTVFRQTEWTELNCLTFILCESSTPSRRWPTMLQSGTKGHQQPLRMCHSHDFQKSSSPLL